jgi:hypothetical protein
VEESKCAVCGAPATHLVEDCDTGKVTPLCKAHVLAGFALGALLSALRNLGEVERGEEKL